MENYKENCSKSSKLIISNLWQDSPKKGKLCLIPPLNNHAPIFVRSLKEDIFCSKYPRLFNIISSELRNFTGTADTTLKFQEETWFVLKRKSQIGQHCLIIYKALLKQCDSNEVCWKLPQSTYDIDWWKTSQLCYTATLSLSSGRLGKDYFYTSSPWIGLLNRDWCWYPPVGGDPSCPCEGSTKLLAK